MAKLVAAPKPTDILGLESTDYSGKVTGMKSLFCLAPALLVMSTPLEACEMTAAFFSASDTEDIMACMDDIFIHQRDDDLSSVLHLAVAVSIDPGVIDAIYAAAGPYWPDLVEQQTTEGATALHIAAQTSDDHRLVTRLLAYGADANAVMDAKSAKLWGDRGTSALHLAALRPDGAAFVTALLAGGADPTWRQRDTEAQPIYIAAKVAETPDTLAALIAFGSGDHAINDPDAAGNTPLMAAVANDRPVTVIRFLLDHGADADAANQDGTTALQFATSYASDPAVVSLIFNASEDPCATDKSGRTAQQLLMLDASPLRHDKTLTRRFHETCIEAAK